MARRRKGGLTEDEIALWQQVARSATPLHSTSAPQPLAPQTPRPEPPSEERPAPLSPFRLGQKADVRRPHDLSLPLADRLRQAPPRMDHRQFDRMMRGKLLPEARIDLHGLTLAEAHPALIRFVLSSHSRGLRLVLVITGKGKPAADDGPIPLRSGALRHQVPHWLHLAPVAPVVQQVAPAHLRHGGAGAYYVYLRRRS